MKSICVFCSSNLGANKIYENVARDIGNLLIDNNKTLVYGGANVGLMRCVAEEVIKRSGHSIGVITHFLAQKHLTQIGLTELIKVETMQERKAKMAELADAFIVLPGGFGTLEELFEVLTAAQLGFHTKPIAIINTNGFYDFLKMQIDNMVKEKMLLEPHANMLIFCESPQDAIEQMEKYSAPVLGKWVDDIRRENGHVVVE